MEEKSVVRPPSCLLREDEYEYQILFHMGEENAYSVRLLMSRDEKRLHILAKKKNGEDQYLWSFKMPKIADKKALSIEERSALFLVHIPKQRFRNHLGALIPRSAENRASYAS